MQISQLDYTSYVGVIGVPLPERVHDAALVLLLDVDVEELIGLEGLAVDVLQDYLRTGYGELIALAAHLLDEDGEVQLAASRYGELVGVNCSLDTERHVVAALVLQALPDVAGGYELALAAGERGGVDLEGHGYGRLVDDEGRQGLGLPRASPP